MVGLSLFVHFMERILEAIVARSLILPAKDSCGSEWPLELMLRAFIAAYTMLFL